MALREGYYRLESSNITKMKLLFLYIYNVYVMIHFKRSTNGFLPFKVSSQEKYLLIAFLPRSTTVFQL